MSRSRFSKGLLPSCMGLFYSDLTKLRGSYRIAAISMQVLLDMKLQMRLLFVDPTSDDIYYFRVFRDCR